MGAAFIVGAALVAAGTLTSAASTALRAAMALQVAGCAVIGGAGIVLLVDGGTVGTGFHSGFTPAFGLDGLSGFFIAVVCLTALPALLSAVDDLGDRPGARTILALSGGFVLALCGLLTARDVVTMLSFWELMTLLPAAAILVARRDREVRQSVFAYLGITHVGGAAVWVTLLSLADRGALGGRPVAGSAAAVLGAVAILGFGTKAGLMPMHSWLPRAHPVAPAHISAVMSAVMIKVAVYLLIRVLFEWTAPPLWVGIVLLGVGAISAVGGILYATVQNELKRLLAFSSIENVGIVAIGLGAALVLRSEGEPAWSGLAFAAALLHVANHAAFKALLFLCAGAFYRTVGDLDLDRLGGLLRRMPVTGWAFLIGCASIAPIPPLNGFASEWLTLQALLHLGYDDSAGIAAAGAVGLVLLGLTAGLVLFCFVKVIGLVLLGEPRTPGVAEAVERPIATRAAVSGLAATCVLLGLLPGTMLPTLAGLAPASERMPARLPVELPGTGTYMPAGVLVALAVIAGLAYLATSQGRRTAAGPAWTCGQRVTPELRWTSAGFSNPLRVVLRAFYRPARQVGVRLHEGVVVAVSYRAEIPHLFDTLLFDPLNRRALQFAAAARRTQSGSLRTYLGYLLALVIGLLGAVRLGVIA